MKRLIAPVLVLLAGVAAAQAPAPPTFDGLDKDKSGGLSKDEVAAFFKDRPAGPNGPVDAAAVFGRWDANTDGTVSKQEFDARPRPPGGGGPPPAN